MDIESEVRSVVASWRASIDDWVPRSREGGASVCLFCDSSTFAEPLWQIGSMPHDVTHGLIEGLEHLLDARVERYLRAAELDFRPRESAIEEIRWVLTRMGEVLTVIDREIGEEVRLKVEPRINEFVTARSLPELRANSDGASAGELSRLIDEVLSEWFSWLPSAAWRREAAIPAGLRCELCVDNFPAFAQLEFAPHAALHSLRRALAIETEKLALDIGIAGTAGDVAARTAVRDIAIREAEGRLERVARALELYVLDEVTSDIERATAGIDVAAPAVESTD